MKTRLTTLSVAAALVLVSGTAFAQGSNDTPITRAQVKQELADLVAVGYRPNSALYNTYPGDILDARERVAAKRAPEGHSELPAQQ
jgi:hypothetical protein